MKRFRWNSSLTVVVITICAAVLSIIPDTAFSVSMRKFLEFLNFTTSDLLNESWLFADYLSNFRFFFTIFLFPIVYAFFKYKWNISDPFDSYFLTICLFCAFLFLDPFITEDRYSSYNDRLWLLALPCLFISIVLFVSLDHAVLLIKICIIIIGVQCIYAVTFYIINVNQFESPRFGSRTSGTFSSPNTLYPLCLLAIPISLTLSNCQKSPEWGWALRSVGLLSLTTLIFTYMRAGWVALSVGLIYILISPHSFIKSFLQRGLILILVIGLLAGTTTVRTPGSFMGNHHDRSFWGRTAIWEVAGRVIYRRPLFGSGLGTYPLQQRRVMTPRLEKFNPLNTEAKSFYFNIVAEFGIFGLGLLILVAWRYAVFYNISMQILSGYSEIKAILFGSHIGVISLAVAGLVDTPILHSDRVPSSLALAILLASSCVIVKHTLSSKLISITPEQLT